VVTVVVVVVLLVVVVNVVAWALDNAVGGSEPEGKSGSSYATSEGGLAAYAQLLADYGHPVTRVRGTVASAALDPDATLIVASGDGQAFLEPDDVDGIAAFVRGGGRTVLVEVPPADLVSIAGIDPEVGDGTRDYHEFAESLGALRTVRTDASAAYDASRDLTPMAREGDRILLGSTDANGGETLLLADGSPIENARIGEADNAAFGLALAGPADTPVVFAEGVHGYGEARGLGALPSRWKVALFAIGVAAIVFAWARARRLGPPDQPTRTLPPARSVYVDAMATTLERTADSAAALAPLGAWSRERIKVRAGLPADADRETIEAAARQMGLTEDEIVALWRAPTSAETVLALGRVVARVTDERTLR
jgi:hypothetical protein